MKKVLITGATGFVGTALTNRLQAQGYTIIALSSRDGDIASPATWADIPPVDHVFHLAARSFVPESWSDPAGYMHTNVQGTMLALEYCRQHTAAMTFVSTYLYGVPDALPLPETAPLRPNNPYSQSKFMAEQGCRFYAEQFGVPVTVIRPFNIYGPGQKAHFLIPHIIQSAQEADIIEVRDLRPRRDYIYLDDLVNGLEATLRVAFADPFTVLNMGSGQSFSVGEAIDLVQSVLGIAKPVKTDEVERRNEIPDTIADIRLAKAVLGWEPQVSFREGLKAMTMA